MAVAARVERRFVHRLEDHAHRLLHHAIDHIRDPQAPLAAAALRDPHASDVADPVAPVEQRAFEHRQRAVEVPRHLVDRLPIRARSALVRRHVRKRLAKSRDHFLHRRQRDLSCRALRLRRRAPRRSSFANRRTTVDPPCLRRANFGCPESQSKLTRSLFDRGRCPSRAALDSARLERLSPPFRYRSSIGLLLGHRLSFSRSTAYRSRGTQQISPGKGRPC